jgi:hypothetical protein
MTPEDEEFEAIAKRQSRIQSDKEAFESAKKREWVGLTDEEIKQIAIDTPIDGIRFARELEAKLKEKNT